MSGSVITQRNIPPHTEKFTIVMIPDTQHLCRYNPSEFDDLFQYIADQKTERNIQFVMHMGDVVSGFGLTNNQWVTAAIGFDILKASGIPFLSNIGNHDFDQNMGTSRTATEFNDLIDLSWLQQQSWFLGNYDGVANTAAKITVGNYSYLFTSTEHVPRAAAVDWTTDIMTAQNSSVDYMIASVHSMLLADATRSTQSELVYYWDELSAFAKMRLTMHGHVYQTNGDPAKARRKDGDITQTVLNYQNESGNTYGDTAVLRFYEIDQSDHSVSATTYNPITDTEYTDGDHEFTFNF